jgi:hypothetical protein
MDNPKQRGGARHRKATPVVSALCGALLTETVMIDIGGIIGAMVYLPGPIDGWFYFSMIFFGGAAAILGAPVSVVVALLTYRRSMVGAPS